MMNSGTLGPFYLSVPRMLAARLISLRKDSKEKLSETTDQPKREIKPTDITILRTLIKKPIQVTQQFRLLFNKPFPSTQSLHEAFFYSVSHTSVYTNGLGYHTFKERY